MAAPYLAEGLGTFTLVFAGPGAAAIDAASGGALGAAGVGAAFGLAVMTMIFALGHVSGCHINPAVTLAFWASGRISRARAFGYVLAQLAGAVLGGLAIRAALDNNFATAAVTHPAIGGAGEALMVELILTALLALVIFGVATDDRAQTPFAAIAVGGYVALAATAWGPLAGASMNPARSFGPALATGEWSDHWVYWAGPALGAVAGMLVYAMLRAPAKATKSPGRPSVLFVCVHHAGRSQMAAAFLRHYAGDAVTALSAGSAPAQAVNPAVAAAMAEVGIDLRGAQPRRLADADVERADVVVTMGCGDACPVFPGRRYLDWELPDPAGLGLEEIRPIREEIRARVRALLAELVPGVATLSGTRRA